MTKKKTKKTYYSDLKPEIVKKAELAVEKIKGCLKTTTEGVFDIGEELSKIKGELEHGQYEDWIRGELGITPQHAGRYRKVFEMLNDQKEHYVRFGVGPTVLFDLAYSSDKAIKKFNDEISKGEVPFELLEKVKKKTAKITKLNKKVVKASVKKIIQMKEQIQKEMKLFQAGKIDSGIESNIKEFGQACQDLSKQLIEFVESISNKSDSSKK
jgi:hypothetical protein